MEKLTISKALIDLLDSMFPDVCPPESYTEKEVWIKMGSIKVIRFLKEKQREFSKTASYDFD